MEGRKKTHTRKYDGITNDWNYEAVCPLISFHVTDLEKFKCFVLAVERVYFLSRQ